MFADCRQREACARQIRAPPSHISVGRQPSGREWRHIGFVAFDSLNLGHGHLAGEGHYEPALSGGPLPCQTRRPARGTGRTSLSRSRRRSPPSAPDARVRQSPGRCSPPPPTTSCSARPPSEGAAECPTDASANTKPGEETTRTALADRVPVSTPTASETTSITCSRRRPRVARARR
jgi:hypothetical protein